MAELSLVSQVIGYVLIAIIGLYSLVVAWWQANVLSGKAMQNPDGSADDWGRQQTHFGIAVADVFLACPVSILGVVLVFVAPRWGFFVLSLIAFWLVWANLMTTSTSLRFAQPKITVGWLAVFPSGILVGAAQLLWTVIHFEAVLGLS